MATFYRRTEGKPKSKVTSSGRNSRKPTEGATSVKAGMEKSPPLSYQQLQDNASIENAVAEGNITVATKAVKRNKGAPGIDGISIEEIQGEMQKHWPRIKEEILEGRYYPQPVKRVEIPKPDGKGVRKLGIPTVMDRIIQQAVLQVISPIFELTFSNHSYGFRPGRSAQQAVFQAQQYIQEGYTFVVDMDLEKFFDKVNHDKLMARVARVIKDKKILLLIRRFLQAGIMEDGLVKPSDEGTPQGGPLSPLLSNIMLDDFDKELEKRGHKFCRYADDCNIYVKSEKAGKRVMESVTKFMTDVLKLKVNLEKSAVDNPWNRKFLGFSFTRGKDPNRIKVHESRVKRFKDKVGGIIKKARGNKMSIIIEEMLMPVVRGWANYFGIAQTQSIFENLDKWIRRKLRVYIWKQWKTDSGRLKNLVRLGLKWEMAKSIVYSNKGPWRLAKTRGMHAALSNKYLESIGFIPIMKLVQIVKAKYA